MVAQKGRDLLLKILDQASWITIAGLRTNRIAFNAEAVDVTDRDSAGRWRELLAAAGIQRAAISGTGLFKDAASDALIRQAFFDGTLLTCRLIVPDFGQIEGPFQITALEYAGSHTGEMTFDIALESAGALSFGALA